MNTFMAVVLAVASQMSPRAKLESQIFRNRPTINQSYCIELARLIDKYARSYNVPGETIAAILSVESDYRLNIINFTSDDYGIGQINNANIVALGLDRVRLLQDLDYSVAMAVRIYSWFYKKYGGTESIMRYNCGTAKSCIMRGYAKTYLKKVNSRMYKPWIR